MYQCFAYMRVHTLQAFLVPRKVRKGSPGTRSPNPDPLQDEKVPLTTKPSLQPSLSAFYTVLFQTLQEAPKMSLLGDLMHPLLASLGTAHTWYRDIVAGKIHLKQK